MKKIGFYIAREVSIPFFLSLFVITFVLLLDRIMKLIELMVSRGVSLRDVGMLFIYVLPSFLTMTIPMAFLLSVLLAFSRLSTDSEIVAMKASGISLYQMFLPVLFFSLLAYMVTFYLIVFALPWGNKSFKGKVYEIAQRKASTGIKEKVFNDDFNGVVLYVDRLKGQGEKFEGVLIYDDREQDGYTILAEEGGIKSDPGRLSVSMRLLNGEIHKTGKGLSYDRVSFSTYDLRLTLKGEDHKDGEKTLKKAGELTISELRMRINELKGQNLKYKAELIELYKKFSIPFACIVFGIIGTPLGIHSSRSGRARGFSISLVMFLVYYIFLTGGESLGERDVINPLIAVWGPNIFFLMTGIYSMVKAAAEKDLRTLLAQLNYSVIRVKRRTVKNKKEEV